MQSFRNLDVWRKAHRLTLDIYVITERFPKAETFGLSTVLRRGSGNVAMKIPEGCGRDLPSDFSHCLAQARGMCVEVEYQLLLAHDLQFIEPAVHSGLQDQVVELRKMVSGLMKTVLAPTI